MLDSFVTTNATQIFNSIKQGNNKTDSLDSTTYITAMISFCTLDEGANKLYHYDSDGELIYSLTKPTLWYKEDDTLKVVAEYTMTLPVRFNGRVVTHATVPIKIVSSLSEKF